MSKMLGYSMVVSVLLTLMVLVAQDAQASYGGGIGGPGCPPPPNHYTQR